MNRHRTRRVKLTVRSALLLFLCSLGVSGIAEADPTGERASAVVELRSFPSRLKALRACVANNTNPKGQRTRHVHLRWTLLPNGKTANVTVADTEMKDEPVALCAKQQLEALQYPIRLLRKAEVTDAMPQELALAF